MSARIDEIIEIIEIVRTDFFYEKSVSISKLRLNAIKKVASQRGIGEGSVSNKYRRELLPDIDGTSEFDDALSDWLLNSSLDLKNILIRHYVNFSDKQRIINLFESVKFEPTPRACDINEASIPDRVKQETYRILRDTSLSREVKAANLHKCQICSKGLLLKNGRPYAEAHHVKPLGTPHNGPDIKENIICVCPNHHVLLDYGAIKLDPLVFKGKGIEFINYHNEKIYGDS